MHKYLFTNTTNHYRLTTALVFIFSFFILSTCRADPPKFADLPPVEKLPEIKELPDPFLFSDGSRVTNKADWDRRRQQIKEIIQYYEYGHIPPPPGNVTPQVLSLEFIFHKTAVKKHVLLTMGPDNNIKANLGIIKPAGSGPFPIILRNDIKIFQFPIAEELVRRGYILADYNRLDLDPDENKIVGPAQAAYPAYDWATLAVWAWGGMRAIDYLMTQDFVDKEKIVFTGHSRGGKTALLAGALDERIALTVPNGSGCGGAGCYRLEGKKCETLDAITKPTRFCYWFQPRLRTFAGFENRLPFDQHFLKALVAPRGLLTTDALGDLWANPLGTQQTYRAALPVFEFLGAPGKIGLHFREGKHDQTVDDFRALADFADLVFFGKKTSREFRKLPFPDAPLPYSWSPPKK